tara:strand:- start:72 stop:266 length:195 start_codon:yes stop_codon:yes gene_type:complete
MAKLIDTTKKYNVELDISEQHIICNALNLWEKEGHTEGYEELYRSIYKKIESVFHRYAQEVNKQ